jgi:prepilin-type N-terminal cleavage/methylation domain-containing protein
MNTRNQILRPSVSAFTLVELLTVVAIIGILAAIIIPTVGKVRNAARWSQGSANVRQVTLSMLMWAKADNRGQLMLSLTKENATAPEVWWYRTLTRYLDSSASSTAVHPILRDPHIDVTATTTQVFHYAPLANLAPQYTQTESTTYAPLKPYRRADAPQQIYFADAAVDTTGAGAHGTISNVDSILWLQTPRADQANLPIDQATGVLGSIRWTDGKAKFGFMDGHIQILRKEEVKKRNVNPFFQDGATR